MCIKKNIIKNSNINYLLDYDNTLINCDSDFLLNKIMYKIMFFNKKFNKINKIYFYLYNNKSINFYNYLNYIKKQKFFFKIKNIYNYIKNIFKNKIFFFIKNNLITSSTNKKIILFLKKTNSLLLYSKKIINYNYYKLKNLKNIKNKIFVSDSINDIYLFFYIKKSILFNSDNLIYKILNKKKINNFIYK